MRSGLTDSQTGVELPSICLANYKALSLTAPRRQINHPKNVFHHSTSCSPADSHSRRDPHRATSNWRNCRFWGHQWHCCWWHNCPCAHNCRRNVNV